MVTFQNKAGLIIKVAGILRGVFKPEEYDKMILPMVLLKRIDSVLEKEKEEILEEYEDMKGNPNVKETLKDIFEQKVDNISLFNFKKLEQYHEYLKENLKAYMESEVFPHIPDAYIDKAKSKIGYEINFTRYFHEYTPLRKTSNILQDFQGIQRDVSMFLKDLFGTSSDKGEVASD